MSLLVRSTFGVLLGTLAGSPAAAQTVDFDQPVPINAQHFRPAVDGQMTLWTDDAGHADAALGTLRVVGGYALRPLMFVPTEGDDPVAHLAHMGHIDLMGGINLGPIRVGAHIPLFVTAGEVTPVEAGIGDIALDVRASFFKSTRNTLGMAVAGRAWAPTTTLRSSVGHRNWAGEATVILDAAVGPVFLAGNLGYKIVPRVDLGNVVWDDQVILRAGAGLAFTERVGLSAEIASSLSVAGPFGANRASPAEFLVGLWHDAGKRVIIRGAAGTQLSGGVGAPNFRALVSVSWEPRKIRDTDGDGYKDPEDGCPEEPEDFDGFQDEDGCPDPLVQVSIRVVNPDGEPIDEAWIDLYLEQGGDADPVHPGFVWQVHPGGYDYDVRANRHFPTEGVLQVPDDTESYVHEVVLNPMALGRLKVTVVSPEEEPIADAQWSVGDERVTDMSGGVGETELPGGEYIVVVQADDYAPARVPALIAENDLTELLVVLERMDVKYIWLYKRVYFATNQHVGLPSSQRVLDEVAETLANYPEITQLGIEGHTDSQGGEAFNLSLSDRRSQWVVEELVGRGVASSRLKPAGYGEDSPAEDLGDEHPWANNRRVELRIITLEP